MFSDGCSATGVQRRLVPLRLLSAAFLDLDRLDATLQRFARTDLDRERERVRDRRLQTSLGLD